MKYPNLKSLISGGIAPAILISMLFSCRSSKPATGYNQPKSKDQLAIEQRIPDGVKVPEYQVLKATGNQNFKPEIYPASWWIGMKNPVLELMIHDFDAKNAIVEMAYPGVRIKSQSSLENPNYLFLQLEISSNAKPGEVKILLKSAGRYSEHFLQLQKRDSNRKMAQGLTAADFVYLLMPDRFANGEPSNDIAAEMNQKDIDRKKLFYRHGGDIKGVMDRLDYLSDLGVTAIWMTPVLENNQPYESYHGYAITDHYKVDRRLGNNQLYLDYVNLVHKKEMKVVKDMIFNHVGNEHFFIKDLPSEDWIHNLPEFKKSNYRDQVHYDPYVAAVDKTTMIEGWFDRHMPDLNTKNEHLARYLIQNSIWWIEFSGIDAYRVDTYPYNDPDFMRNWSKAVLDEYPDFYICLESWVTGSANQAYFTESQQSKAVLGEKQVHPIDFQLQYAITDALTKPQGWLDGVAKLYHTLTSDYLVRSPEKNLIFLDNHDFSRMFSTLNEDQEKLRSAIAWLLTERGIPQLYYGTEILMKGISNPDGYVRNDFPGGWQEDKSNKFKAKGRSRSENEMHNYVSKLANYRKNNSALKTGKLMHFIPQDGVYTYFRYDEKNCVMVVMNTSDKVQKLDKKRFEEVLQKYNRFMDISSNKKVDINNLKLEKFQTLIIECRQ
ncbi:MAG: glycoside hydrolase family 13 protein [Saprospiraceae bacterium]